MSRLWHTRALWAVVLVLAALTPDRALLAQRPSLGSLRSPLTGERTYLFLAPGAHLSSVQRVAVTAGATFERERESSCQPTVHGCVRGPRVVGLALAAPGLTGGRLAFGGAWIAEPLTGLAGTVSTLRTWGSAAQVEPNQSFVGPGVTAYLLGFNVAVTSYWRVAGDAPREAWFASFSMGVGF